MPPKRDASTAFEERESPVAKWEGYKVTELVEQLRRRGLPASGKKAVLIGRLVEWEASNSEGLHAESPRKDDKARQGDAAVAPISPLAKNKRGKKMKSPEAIIFQHVNASGAFRPKDFVPAPNAKFKDKLKRIRKERMFMIDRERNTDLNGVQTETFTIAGSTGNLYTCVIGPQCRCDCRDAIFRGNTCKHISYALVIILKAPIYMCYQEGFFPEEIATIFTNAPITRLPSFDFAKSSTLEHHGKRKPIEGACPICVCDFEEDEKLVWCMAACGQNFHDDCFNQWKKTRGDSITCVYCRQPWRDETTSSSASSLRDLKARAPKKGWHHNISHLPEYQQYQGDAQPESL